MQLDNPYAAPMNVFYTVPLSVPIGGMIVIIYPNVYNQFPSHFTTSCSITLHCKTSRLGSLSW